MPARPQDLPDTHTLCQRFAELMVQEEHDLNSYSEETLICDAKYQELLALHGGRFIDHPSVREKLQRLCVNVEARTERIRSGLEDKDGAEKDPKGAQESRPRSG